MIYVADAKRAGRNGHFYAAVDGIVPIDASQPTGLPAYRSYTRIFDGMGDLQTLSFQYETDSMDTGDLYYLDDVSVSCQASSGTSEV